MRQLLVLLVALGAALAGCTNDAPESTENGDGETPLPDFDDGFGAERDLDVESSAFGPGDAIPPEHTCDGANTPPPLNVTNVPANATSLALIVHDPDAGDDGFVHWIAWNIPAQNGTLAVDASGVVQGKNGAGRTGYGGPCPPSGTHRYDFRVYALDATLDLPADATVEDLKEAMQGRIVSWGEYMGRYTRGSGEDGDANDSEDTNESEDANDTLDDPTDNDEPSADDLDNGNDTP